MLPVRAHPDCSSTRAASSASQSKQESRQSIPTTTLSDKPIPSPPSLHSSISSSSSHHVSSTASALTSTSSPGPSSLACCVPSSSSSAKSSSFSISFSPNASPSASLPADPLPFTTGNVARSRRKALAPASKRTSSSVPRSRSKLEEAHHERTRLFPQEWHLLTLRSSPIPQQLPHTLHILLRQTSLFPKITLA